MIKEEYELDMRETNATLTIVIPVYNEAENIKTAIECIEAEVHPLHIISIVYDFDEDNTIPVVLELQRKFDNITLVKNKYGRGALNAIKTGLESADSTFVVVTMADLSDPPAVINDMYMKAVETNADIVCASRYMRGGRQIGGPPIKGLMSRIAGLSLYYLAKVPTHDATNSYKLYRTAFIKEQKLESSGGFEIGIELIAKAYVQGKIITETPTTWRDRAAGTSNFKLIEWLPHYIHWFCYAFNTHRIGIRRFLPQLIKYFFAGCACALLDWSVFYVLHYLCALPYMGAAALAFMMAVTLNYYLSRKVFAASGRSKKMEYLLIVCASLIGLGIDLAAMYVLIQHFYMPAMLAKILSTAIGFLYNFAARQFFIFKAPLKTPVMR